MVTVAAGREGGEAHGGSAGPPGSHTCHFHSRFVAKASHRYLEGESKTFGEQLSVTHFLNHPASADSSVLNACPCPAPCLTLHYISFFLPLPLESKLHEVRLCLILFTAVSAALRALPGIQKPLR